MSWTNLLNELLPLVKDGFAGIHLEAPAPESAGDAGREEVMD
jgi:hypothetical protein